MSDAGHTESDSAPGADGLADDDGAPLIGIDTPVPKLPRGKGARLSVQSLFRIGMLGVMLFAVLALRKPCSDGAANFIGGFEPPVDAGAHTAPPSRVRPPPGTEYVRLRGDETEDELREKLRGLRGVRARDAGTGAGVAAPADAARP